MAGEIFWGFINWFLCSLVLYQLMPLFQNLYLPFFKHCSVSRTRNLSNILVIVLFFLFVSWSWQQPLRRKTNLNGYKRARVVRTLFLSLCLHNFFFLVLPTCVCWGLNCGVTSKASVFVSLKNVLWWFTLNLSLYTVSLNGLYDILYWQHMVPVLWHIHWACLSIVKPNHGQALLVGKSMNWLTMGTSHASDDSKIIWNPINQLILTFWLSTFVVIETFSLLMATVSLTFFLLKLKLSLKYIFFGHIEWIESSSLFAKWSNTVWKHSHWSCFDWYGHICTRSRNQGPRELRWKAMFFFENEVYWS